MTSQCDLMDRNKFMYLSPNEQEMLLKKSNEEKRKQRLLQVRQQEKASSLRIREKFKNQKTKSILNAAVELQGEYQVDQKEKQQKLLQQLEQRLKAIGQAHEFDVKENDGNRKELSAELQTKILQRTKEAYEKLRESQMHQEMVLSQEKALRLKIQEMEAARKNNIISQPRPPPYPIKDLEPLKLVASHSKQSMESFSTTWFHLGTTLDLKSYPEFVVDKASQEEQIDARDAAFEERHRMFEQKEKVAQEIEERKEKADLRHKYARNEVILQQEKNALMGELEDFDIKDRHRRKQVVADIPKKIFQPPYQRQEDAKLKQYDLEQAFERIHTVTCDDPMERYYKNAEDILDDKRKDEVSRLAIPEKDFVELPAQRKQDEIEETSSTAFVEDRSITREGDNQKRLERLRKKIKNQQLNATSSQLSQADDSSDIDSASVVKEALEKSSQHSLRQQYESLRSMNIESACESFPPDDRPSSEGKTSHVPAMADTLTPQSPPEPFNPLTQQNLAYNQRLLEHQKHVAKLQKRQLVNRKVNYQLEQELHKNKVDVFMPPIEEGASPTTILSGSRLDEASLVSHRSDGVPIPDTSLPLQKDTSVSGDPDLDVSIQNTDQDSQQGLSNRGSDDVSLSLSCIRTESLQQYPLTEDSVPSKTPVLMEESIEHNEDINRSDVFLRGGDKNEEDTGTQTSFEMKPSDTETVEKSSVDLEKLQRKREELRSQYPDLFKGASDTRPSLDMLDRIRNHRESLRKQRELLQKRRYDRNVESLEETLRKSTQPSPLEDAPHIESGPNSNSRVEQKFGDVDFHVEKTTSRGVVSPTEVSRNDDSFVVEEGIHSSSTLSSSKSLESTRVSIISAGNRRPSSIGFTPAADISISSRSLKASSAVPSVENILEELRNLQTRVMLHQEEDELLKSNQSKTLEVTGDSGIPHSSVGIQRESLSLSPKSSPTAEIPKFPTSQGTQRSTIGAERTLSEGNSIEASRSKVFSKEIEKQVPHVPILTSSSFASRETGFNVGESRTGLRVSEHPHVSPIKEVDEYPMTPFKKQSSLGSLQEQSLSASSFPDPHSSDYNEDGLSLVRCPTVNQSNQSKSHVDDVFVPLPLNEADGNLSNTLLGSQRIRQSSNQSDQPFFELGETTRSRLDSDNKQLTTLILEGSTTTGGVSSATSPTPDASPLFLPQTQDDSVEIPPQDSFSGSQLDTKSGYNNFKNLEGVSALTPVGHQEDLGNQKAGTDSDTASVTIEELLENNRSVLPKSFVLSGSTSTTSDSLNSSERYKALLERVKQLPLIHAREQELLVRSYQENSTLPGDEELGDSTGDRLSTSESLIEAGGDGSLIYSTGSLTNTTDHSFKNLSHADTTGDQSYQGMTNVSDFPPRIPKSFHEMQSYPNKAEDVSANAFVDIDLRHSYPGIVNNQTFKDSDHADGEFKDLTGMVDSQYDENASIDVQEGYNRSDAGLRSHLDSGNVQSFLDVSAKPPGDFSLTTADFRELPPMKSSDFAEHSSREFHDLPRYNLDRSRDNLIPETGQLSLSPRFAQQAHDSTELNFTNENRSKTEFHEFSSSHHLMTQTITSEDDDNDGSAGNDTTLRTQDPTYGINQYHQKDNEDTSPQPPPIIFTGGQHQSAPSIHSISSGGELFASDFMEDKNRNKFVMSYFHDTSPEMFSFTKNGNTGSDTRSDLLSLSQESYLPLPADYQQYHVASGEENDKVMSFTGQQHSEGSFSGRSLKSPPQLEFGYGNIQENPIPAYGIEQQTLLIQPSAQSSEDQSSSLSPSFSHKDSESPSTSNNTPYDSVLNTNNNARPVGRRSTDLKKSPQTAHVVSPRNDHDSIPTLSYTETLSRQSASVLKSDNTEIPTLSHTTSKKSSLSSTQMDKESSVPTLSRTTSSSKHPQHAGSSEIQTLSYTSSLSRYSLPRKFADSDDMPTLSHTTSLNRSLQQKGDLSVGNLSRVSSKDTLKHSKDSQFPEYERRVPSRPAFSHSNSTGTSNSQREKSDSGHRHSLSPKTTTVSRSDRNTSSLLTSERTMSELVNLNSTTSSEYLEHQDSSFIDKNTMDLISQLISSKSQHSDTESSELFTVGRLSLKSSQGVFGREMDLQEKRTELSLLSDLNLSSMSEDCINWSSIVPVTSKDSDTDKSPTLSDVVTKVESLQDAFQKSRKKFVLESKRRQDEVKRKAIEHYEKTNKQKTDVVKKKTRQTKFTLKSDVKPTTDGKVSSTDSGTEKLDRVKHKGSMIENKKRTKRLYDRLPEVQKQTAEKERQEAGKKNREKAQEFHKKLQSKIRKNLQEQQQKPKQKKR